MSLKAVLAQALSRNKAIEKKLLWEQKHREDHGSANTMSLKSRDGEVRTVTILSKDALVSPNHVDVLRAGTSAKGRGQGKRSPDSCL